MYAPIQKRARIVIAAKLIDCLDLEIEPKAGEIGIKRHRPLETRDRLFEAPGIEPGGAKHSVSFGKARIDRNALFARLLSFVVTSGEEGDHGERPKREAVTVIQPHGSLGGRQRLLEVVARAAPSAHSRLCD